MIFSSFIIYIILYGTKHFNFKNIISCQGYIWDLDNNGQSTFNNESLNHLSTVSQRENLDLILTANDEREIDSFLYKRLIIPPGMICKYIFPDHVDKIVNQLLSKINLKEY
ncbi:hypothetical protein HZS_2104 [Henneguya salminicola]|nr:hypothetical protein HZS_2104 [Henneguya salminicola]